MDDHIRVSDADRDRAAGRLREHFAAGRLTQDELDERVSAALNARTFGDLRAVMADLPEPAPVPPGAGPYPRQPPLWLAPRRPRLAPMLLLLLLLALILPGGHWFFWGFFPFLFMFWIAASVAGIFAMTQLRHHHHHRGGGWHPPG